MICELAEKVEPEARDHACGRCAGATCAGEMRRFLEVYNAAWERNWGFVPLTEKEVSPLRQGAQAVLDENWAMIAEKEDGESVGAALTLPDFNQVLEKMNGPAAAVRLVALPAPAQEDRPRARGFALGVKPEYQHTGVAARSTSSTSTRPRSHAADGRRDGLDPRDQQAR